MKQCLIITGASHGIGLATAQYFKKNGWDLITLSRTPCPLAGATHFSVDFSNIQWPTLITESLTQTLKDYDRLCILHNAATLQKDTVVNLTGAALQAVLQLNVIAPQQLNQMLIPYLPKSSSILYVGSTLSTLGTANTASYIISKHALLGLMRATMCDLAGLEIHTACICPGCTDTDMLHTHAQHNPKVITALAALSTFNRLIQPEEIAATLLFAATHPVIHGAVLHANLGQM